MTKFGYKLFEYNSKTDSLYPLFIDKTKPIPVDTWLDAEYKPTDKFADRPGWHIGEVPDAPWLKGYDGSELGLYRSRFKYGKRVWCLVEYSADICYEDELKAKGAKYFTDKIPVNGYYSFIETADHVWIIAGAMRIVKVLSEDERQNILLDAGYDEKKAYAPYFAGFEKKLKKNTTN